MHSAGVSAYSGPTMQSSQKSALQNLIKGYTGGFLMHQQNAGPSVEAVSSIDDSSSRVSLNRSARDADTFSANQYGSEWPR